MSISGIGAGHPAWHETGKVKKNHNSGTGFADSMADAGMTGAFSFQKTSAQKAGQNMILETYRASASAGVNNVKPAYEKYESGNYKIVPDNENGCFDIYNQQGEKLGVFSYSDIKVRQDSATGKQFLISEHGTMSYDVLVMDNELKDALQNAMGVRTLEAETLQGYTLKTHSGTGIQYIVKDGEEGRSGKTLLQSEADRKQFEELAETYLNKYPNLIESKEEACIWADFEIRGLAQHTNNGIISMGYDGMSYNDNSNDKNNWSIRFSEDAYKMLFGWLQSNRGGIEETQIQMFCRKNLL